MTDFTRYARDPVAFIDDFIPLNEKGQPWRLSAHQRLVLRHAIQWDSNGRLRLRILLWGEMKKSGKTFLMACLALWWAFTRAQTEVIICANDLEQSMSRVFATAVALCKFNPALAASVTPRATAIHVSNGTKISAIASDYRGAAGSRHSLVVFDELWGFDSENAQRLYEELTPPPTEPDAWLLIGTYAGFTGESKLLERLYLEGHTGEPLDVGDASFDGELFRAGALVMFWSHTPRQPWQTDEYYDEQRRSLRPNTFARIHQNRWVTAESTFITPELWDPCVDPSLHPAVADRSMQLLIGVDAAQKHDYAAAVGVRWEGDKLVLATHRIWKPSPTEPLDLEATIEAHLRELHERFRLVEVVCDPWQMARSIATLKGAGLPIRELPQTSASTTQFGQNLFELLNSRTLRLYPADDLRQQALNTVALESARGFRIAKDKNSKKIDAIVALAMACMSAVDQKKNAPRAIRVWDMWGRGLIHGTDRNGVEYRNGRPWNGTLPEVRDGKGRIVVCAMTFVDGKWVG